MSSSDILDILQVKRNTESSSLSPVLQSLKGSANAPTKKAKKTDKKGMPRELYSLLESEKIEEEPSIMPSRSMLRAKPQLGAMKVQKW
jgi:hypothetical protein